jgi:hypothetical protein
MTGYRQSSFDPDAYEQPGAPLRPFNRVQWAGFALAMAGLAINLVYLAGFFGLIRPLLDGISPAVALILVGVVLINSRRAPGTLVGAEQRGRNRKLLVVTLAVCAVILAAALAIDSLGA